MKTVVIYSGRFQPFHNGHYEGYKKLTEKFGKRNVFLATSNKQDPDKNPFTFDEKKQIITAMYNIPTQNIVMTQNPNMPKEILNKYDPESTAFVTAFSEEDLRRKDGLQGKYFKEWADESTTEPFKNNGYFVEISTQTTRDKEPISSTRIREVLGNPGIKTKDKVEFFKMTYDKFDTTLFRMMKDAIQKSKRRLPGKSRARERGDPAFRYLLRESFTKYGASQSSAVTVFL